MARLWCQRTSKSSWVSTPGAAQHPFDVSEAVSYLPGQNMNTSLSVVDFDSKDGSYEFILKAAFGTLSSLYPAAVVVNPQLCKAEASPSDKRVRRVFRRRHRSR
jgi:hypothetical protein